MATWPPSLPDTENAFVFNLVNSPTYFQPEGPLLGGYQLPGSQEPGDGWTWMTGEAWSYTKWGPGQPDNGGEQEDSIHFSAAGGGTWNDKSSTGQYHRSFIIERDNTCTPRPAKGTAQLVNGFVIGATVTDGGCGYTNPPAVLIKGGGGSGAAARAVIANGEVTGIQILDAGFGYTSEPRVVIGSPPFVPSVTIATSRIKVTQSVVLGWRYVLETSTNVVDWVPTGTPFTADSESIATEFEVDTVGRHFRLRVVQ